MADRRAWLGFDHHNMTPADKGAAIPQVIWKTQDGIVQAYGTTVPTDTTAGYIPGGLFFKTDGTVYINTGSASSCTFAKHNEIANLTGNITQAAVAAEHAAGAIGTGVAPATYRRTENGIIITEIKIDLTGLNSGGTENDAIGLVSGGACYIGRNVVANTGIVYKMELICLELPVGGSTDINVVENSAANIVEDAAVGADYGVDGGTMAAGIVVTNDSPSLTADEYLYLASGGTTDDTYTAGQLLVRMFGHALLA